MRPRGDLAGFCRRVYKVAPRRLVILWALVGFSPIVYQVALWTIRLAALIDLYAPIINYHDLRQCHSTLVRRSKIARFILSEAYFFVPKERMSNDIHR